MLTFRPRFFLFIFHFLVVIPLLHPSVLAGACQSLSLFLSSRPLALSPPIPLFDSLTTSISCFPRAFIFHQAMFFIWGSTTSRLHPSINPCNGTTYAMFLILTVPTILFLIFVYLLILYILGAPSCFICCLSFHDCFFGYISPFGCISPFLVSISSYVFISIYVLIFFLCIYL